MYLFIYIYIHGCLGFQLLRLGFSEQAGQKHIASVGVRAGRAGSCDTWNGATRWIWGNLSWKT